MKTWVTAEVLKLIGAIANVKNVSKTQQGGDYDTDGVYVEPANSQNGIWVRGFVTDGKPLKASDIVDVELVEVTAGQSDGQLPNDPDLISLHGQIRAELARAGFTTVDSMDPYF